MAAIPRHSALPRVGYVLKKYPRLSETFILNEILGLEAMGIDVSVLSLRLPDEGRFHRDLASVRAGVSYVPQQGSAAALESYRALCDLGPDAPARLSRVLAFVDRLPDERRHSVLLQGSLVAGTVRSLGLNHLHAHFMTVAAQVCYLAHILTGTPFTVTAHAKDIYRDAVDPDVFSEIARGARSIVTVCDANRAYIEQRFLRGGGEVVRIYNGIPLERLVPLGAPRDPLLVLGAGRLVEKKGFDVLLEACARLRRRSVDLRCVIIGDGDQRAALELQRDRLGLARHVEFVGSQTHDGVLGWIERARVLASPCITGTDGNRDALPTVLLEALALGVPPVSTPVGGIREIIDHGVDGLVVAENDPVSLADAIERLLRDDALWSAMSAAGPVKVRGRFDQRRTLPGLAALFGAARPAPAEVVA